MSDKTVPHKDLNSLLLFSGRISEVHLKNMKSFPWMFFNDISEVGLEYDIATKKEDASFVNYSLTLTGENDNLDKRYAALESAVRALFWKEVKVKVSINGTEVFKSE